VWAAGFAVHPIAAASGLDVEDDGRITVDPMMRSVSHPEVYAVGDSAYTIGENGQPLPMSCASAGFTRMQATAAIVGDLTWSLRGRPAARVKAAVLRGTAWNMRYPTYGLPTRRHRLTTAPYRSTEAVAG
jgi:NADH dehydrogenase